MSQFLPSNTALSTFIGRLFNKWGMPYTITPSGSQKVITPRPRFIETFDSGAWDTINKWAITNGGGGVLPSASVGTGALSSGVTLNGFSKAASFNTPAGGPNFKLTEPEYNIFEDRIQFEFPVLATGHRFWGSGTSLASPTIANPITQGMGWEITTAGILTPVVYQSGTRVGPGSGLVVTDSFVQLSDGATHKYFRWFAGAIAFWCLDTQENIVAYYRTGASGPDINGLPLLYQCISNGSTAVTMSIGGLNVAETAGTSSIPLLNNQAGGYDEQRGNLDTNTALVNAVAATTTQTGADQLNVNGRGVTVVLNMATVGTGSVTITIQGKDIVSGQYYTLLVGAAVTTNSVNVYTVYPGATVTANVSANAALPRTWRVLVTANNANATTYTVGATVSV